MKKLLIVIISLSVSASVEGQIFSRPRQSSSSRPVTEEKSETRAMSNENATGENVASQSIRFRGPRQNGDYVNRADKNRRQAINEVLAKIEGNMVAIPGSRIMMGRYEVTQGEWRVIMNANPSSFKGDNLPVENVSIEDCELFIRKLNQLSGKRYRLPTRREWLKAAIGSEEVMTEEGQNGAVKESSEHMQEAWYSRNSASQTHEVGLKKSNRYGLFDMSGNVQEWCINDDKLIKGEYLASGGAYDCDEVRLQVEAVVTAGKGDRASSCGFRLVLEK